MLNFGKAGKTDTAPYERREEKGERRKQSFDSTGSN